jgi:hypothetical protein
MRIVNSQPADQVASIAPIGVVYDGFGAQAAVAAANGMVQLWLPLGSGVSLFVIDCMASLGTAGDIVVCSYNTALATLAMAGVSTALGSPAGSGQVRTGSNAGILGTQMQRLSLPANQSMQVVRPWELVLPQNQGVLIAAVTVNVALTVTYRWTEFGG